MDFLVRHAKGFGTLFYAVNPYETMFETIKDLPHPSWTAQVSVKREKSTKKEMFEFYKGLGI